MRKAQERAHILEGLKIALDFIDEVIAIIRNSKTIPESKERLCDRFGLDDLQATAIVQMQLGKLAGMEKQKIEDELSEKIAFIKECQEILGSQARVLDIVKTEALNLRDKYADDRRTEISAVSGEVDIEDLIPEEMCVVTKTTGGYIKRLPADTYSVQHRGGRGIMGMQTREDDFVESMFVCNSHDYIMMFTTFGRMYKLKAYEIPEGSRQGKGMNIVNIIPLQPEEKVSMILPCRDIDEANFVIMGTKNGVIKRTPLEAFKNVRKTGIIALELDEGDELRFVALSDGSKTLLVATKKGKAIRFAESDVRPMGRTARGVRSIKLRQDDEVVAMAACDEDAVILTISETGYGRRSDVTDYRLQSRGGKGITNYKVEKYGDVAAVLTVTDEEDVIMISSDGVIIRIAVAGISKFARPSKGVRVMKFGKDSQAYVLSASATPHDEDEITGEAEAPDADSAADADEIEETEDNSEE
jgi:DNA gyrase subunit A